VYKNELKTCPGAAVQVQPPWSVIEAGGGKSAAGDHLAGSPRPAGSSAATASHGHGEMGGLVVGNSGPPLSLVRGSCTSCSAATLLRPTVCVIWVEQQSAVTAHPSSIYPAATRVRTNHGDDDAPRCHPRRTPGRSAEPACYDQRGKQIHGVLLLAAGVGLPASLIY
jgi:hypothetical protein